MTAAKASAPAKPVYLLRGEDPTLLADAVRDLVAALVGDEDSNLAIEDLAFTPGDEQRMPALLDACLTPPFLTDRRVVLVRNAGSVTSDEAARIVDYLADPLDTTRLVLIGGGGTVPAKLVTAIKA